MYWWSPNRCFSFRWRICQPGILWARVGQKDRWSFSETEKGGGLVRKNSTSRVVQGSRGKWTGSKNYSTPFGAPGTFQHHFPLFIFNPMQQTSGHILPAFLMFVLRDFNRFFLTQGGGVLIFMPLCGPPGLIETVHKTTVKSKQNSPKVSKSLRAFLIFIHIHTF